MSSELRVNVLRGSTANGNITIQGEGASNLGGATMQLQQGLAKMHCVIDQTSTQSIVGSFNLSSISDGGTAKTTKTMTNAMSDTTYTISGSGRLDTGGNACIHNQDKDITKTASVFGVYHIRQDGSVSDTAASMSVVHGDLA